jgi:hypothetical protein
MDDISHPRYSKTQNRLFENYCNSRCLRWSREDGGQLSSLFIRCGQVLSSGKQVIVHVGLRCMAARAHKPMQNVSAERSHQAAGCKPPHRKTANARLRAWRPFDKGFSAQAQAAGRSCPLFLLSNPHGHTGAPRGARRALQGSTAAAAAAAGGQAPPQGPTPTRFRAPPPPPGLTIVRHLTALRNG